MTHCYTHFLAIPVLSVAVVSSSLGQDAPLADDEAGRDYIAEMDAIVDAAAHTIAEADDDVPMPAETEVGEGDTVQALMAELDRKQKELDAANAEILRLRAVVKEMSSAGKTDNFTMHYNMACVYKNQGRYRKAEQHFLMALERRPNEPDVHYNLGILYDDDLKDAAKARRHYERFIELAPGDKDAAKVQEWLLLLTR